MGSLEEDMLPLLIDAKEAVEVFVDFVATYLHNDASYTDCRSRMLCEVNQGSMQFGMMWSMFVYTCSIFLSFAMHRDQRVSSSMDAVRLGRSGRNCLKVFNRCPFSLWNPEYD
ncbi:unnamed protein product [Orchesella dallaii]|uniref:Uncharacterized protein n=1 Tax=Orchesella dallaii TaxID=48710 RepID=A0ABP1Q778_9HEXA